jgi:hypothetical protein
MDRMMMILKPCNTMQQYSEKGWCNELVHPCFHPLQRGNDVDIEGVQLLLMLLHYYWCCYCHVNHTIMCGGSRVVVVCGDDEASYHHVQNYHHSEDGVVVHHGGGDVSLSGSCAVVLFSQLVWLGDITMVRTGGALL